MAWMIYIRPHEKVSYSFIMLSADYTQYKRSERTACIVFI